MTLSISGFDSKIEESPLVELLDAQRAPVRVCCGRRAWQLLEPLRLHCDCPLDFELIAPNSAPAPGPAVVVLDARDLHGPDRAMLLAAAELALPGRPVVIGGSDNRQTLLEAINQWQALRVLPHEAPLEAIVDAIRRAQELLSLHIVVERCAHDLLVRCHRLAATIEELKATRERLLHAERLATVGRTVGAIMLRMKEQSQRLEAFREAVSATPNDRCSPSATARTLELMGNLAEAQSCFDALLADMLALVEVRPTEMHLELELIDALVERTVRLFQYDPLGHERDIRVSCDTRLKVRVDRNRLRHALLNLLRNAAQATRPSDKIHVRTCAHAETVQIEVEDTGSGMTPETLEKIFTPFFTTKGSNGMGLGLRLARATIEAHGGSLDCSTAIGRGSSFRIRLPIAASNTR